jgi:hypothetical protein
MLDNLRDQDSSPFNQVEGDKNNNENPELGLKIKNRRQFNGIILGLKPHQLFILLMMLLLVVGLLGTMFLLVTGKIVPSFL